MGEKINVGRKECRLRACLNVGPNDKNVLKALDKISLGEKAGENVNEGENDFATACLNAAERENESDGVTVML